jgi:hypothetical protein
MPTKDYRIWLTDHAFIVAEFVMARGQVVSFVVGLMLVAPGRELNVARYDTAHGAPHRDLLGLRRGLLQKTWYPDWKPGQIMRLAVDDFSRNYEDYIRNYLQN